MKTVFLLLLVSIPCFSQTPVDTLTALADRWAMEDDHVVSLYRDHIEKGDHRAALETKYAPQVHAAMLVADAERKRLLGKLKTPQDQADKNAAVLFARILSGDVILPNSLQICSHYLGHLQKRVGQ